MTESVMTEPVMTVEEIRECLPHRYPFLLVDRVLSLDPGKTITALKNVTIGEPFFVGHFPQQAIMPGVLIIEALAQTAGLLTIKSVATEAVGEDQPLFFLAGVDKARFRKMVTPGDQLMLHSEAISIKSRIMKHRTTATLNGELACSAEIICARP